MNSEMQKMVCATEKFIDWLDQTPPRGLQGPPGKNGKDGQPGPQGVPGPVGPAGTNGQNGQDGEDGEQGEQGIQGIQGPPGPNDRLAYGTFSYFDSNFDSTLDSYYVTDKGSEGLFVYTPGLSDTVDGYMVIQKSGKKFKRAFDGTPNVKWWKAKGDGLSDDTAAIQAAVNYNIGGSLYFPAGIYIADNIQNNSVNIEGAGSNVTFLRVKTNGATFFKLGYNAPLFRHKKVSGLTIDGINRLRDGITFSSNTFTEVSGRWVIDQVVIQNCKKGIHKPTGNIGNTYSNCLFQLNEYGYFAVGSIDPLMHAGFDTFNVCTFATSYKSGAYVSSSVSGTGLSVFNECHFEANMGYGLFVDSYDTGYVAFALNNVWFEANASYETVNIEGVDYQPLDAYFKDATNVVIHGSHVSKIEVKNTTISLYNCYMTLLAFRQYDAESVVNIYDAVCGEYSGNYIVRSIKDQLRTLSGTSGIFLAEKPKIIKQRGVAKTAISYSNIRQYSMTGTSTYLSTPVQDNYIFPIAAEFTINASGQALTATTALTTGKYYVLSISIKHISGNLPNLTWNYNFFVSGQIGPMLKTHWRTFSVIGLCTAVGSSATLYISNTLPGATSITLRMQGLQIVEFDTEREAIQYYNENILSTELPVEVYAPAIPSSGNWFVGDKIINSAPTVGQPKRWINTVSGTPGTFVSEGNL